MFKMNLFGLTLVFYEVNALRKDKNYKKLLFSRKNYNF